MAQRPSCSPGAKLHPGNPFTKPPRSTTIPAIAAGTEKILGLIEQQVAQSRASVVRRTKELEEELKRVQVRLRILL